MIYRRVLSSATRWAVTWLGLIVFVSALWLLCEGIELVGRLV